MATSEAERLLRIARRSPRTRGDGPDKSPYGGVGGKTFSPHARGWPGRQGGAPGARPGSPRTRGDGPEFVARFRAAFNSSPRTRGDGPGFATNPTITIGVLPARAGMAR